MHYNFTFNFQFFLLQKICCGKQFGKAEVLLFPEKEVYSSGDEVFIEVHPNNKSDTFVLIPKENQITSYLLMNGTCNPTNLTDFQNFSVINFYRLKQICYLKVIFLSVTSKGQFTVHSFLLSIKSNCVSSSTKKLSLLGSPGEIFFKLSRDTTNLFANDNFSVFVEFDNHGVLVNKSEVYFTFIGNNSKNQ